MALVKEKKKEIIKSFKASEKDTGSPSVQIALLTERINSLSSHFKEHKRDHHSRQGLLRMVSIRRRLLEYLKKKDLKEYQGLLKKLDLRK
ncbi:MAG: 30S ribosomal protein S15 [Candidatus Omnitrophica bacterium]|nr:30S ribosomal protein S15 [Candidatus Omnitrophota bacterium]MCM8790849.1 30S ribosomal protein S15 [Candidatus Omnitrophota bacterium]